MTAMVSLRLPRGLRRELERLAERERKDRSEVIRELLDQGLREKKLEQALEAYREGRVSLGKAAELSGLSIWEMLDILRDRKIPLNYTAEDLEADLRALEALR